MAPDPISVSDHENGSKAAPIAAFEAGLGPVGFLMTMTEHQTAAVKLQAVNALLSVLLTITLIPPFGMIGAALASSSVLVIWNLAMYWSVRQRLNIDPTVLRWFATLP